MSPFCTDAAARSVQFFWLPGASPLPSPESHPGYLIGRGALTGRGDLTGTGDVIGRGALIRGGDATGLGPLRGDRGGIGRFGLKNGMATLGTSRAYRAEESGARKAWTCATFSSSSWVRRAPVTNFYYIDPFTTQASNVRDGVPLH